MRRELSRNYLSDMIVRKQRKKNFHDANLNVHGFGIVPICLCEPFSVRLISAPFINSFSLPKQFAIVSTFLMAVVFAEPPAPRSSYLPPQARSFSAPSSQYGAPSQQGQGRTNYAPPQPRQNYGAPAQQPRNQYGPPQVSYFNKISDSI